LQDHPALRSMPRSFRREIARTLTARAWEEQALSKENPPQAEQRTGEETL
jgi:hypothetical protein